MGDEEGAHRSRDLRCETGAVPGGGNSVFESLWVGNRSPCEDRKGRESPGRGQGERGEADGTVGGRIVSLM